ncbi:hypothetical protein H4219_000810 [Mycoemilia scoparia]|uniref:Phospholipase n=1 Tax=Mycoemilia scoparia TaxID=417184 RepID=A0A9W8DWJ7_9FUNG|nr:hypothetical protein H4219_000810 [Mycoemilia scoparia]
MPAPSVSVSGTKKGEEINGDAEVKQNSSSLMPTNTLGTEPPRLSSSSSYAEHRGSAQWVKLFGDMVRRSEDIQRINGEGPEMQNGGEPENVNKLPSKEVASTPVVNDSNDEDVRFVVDDFGDSRRPNYHEHSSPASQGVSLDAQAWNGFGHIPSETLLAPNGHSRRDNQGHTNFAKEHSDNEKREDQSTDLGTHKAEPGASGRNGKEKEKDDAAAAAADQKSSRLGAAAKKIRGSELTNKFRRAVGKATVITRLKAPENELRSASGHGVFPFLQDALFVPMFYFMRDEHGNRPAPIIFNAIQLAVLSPHSEPSLEEPDEPHHHLSLSQLHQHHHHHFTIRIQLQYGDVKWVIVRRLNDFLTLHTMLNLRKFQGRIPYVPPFPQQFSYALGKARFHRRHEEREQRLQDAENERLKALEDYLISTLQHLNLRPSYEMCAFLELSAVSIFKNTGWKGKEGFLDRRVEHITGKFCTPRELRRWKRQWVLVRDSYIAFCSHISDPYPADVLLADSQFKMTYKKKKLTGHPLHSYRITLSTANRVVQLRSDSERSIKEWKRSIEMMTASSKWTKPHRFDSFAPIRQNSRVMWFVDGADYFHAVSEAIENAKETIYIMDWWLSPELYLRRPYAQNEEYRLDRLLKRKAEEGVEIYISLFKEVTVSLTINSAYSKKKLQSLHKNIHVQRHPDHTPGGTMFWAHHEKIVVVDNTFGFVGGLDLCFGRWDNHYHRLADYHLPAEDGIPEELTRNFFGQDYNNARIHDFAEVNKYWTTIVNRTMTPRMPWHDIHMGMIGQPARDVARHFIQRWNFLKASKSQHRPSLPMLMPSGDFSSKRNDFQYKGTITTQTIRSSAEWSLGIHREDSIHTAYCELIRGASHFVYIENQFFISSAKSDPAYTVKNRIAEAIVDRIIRAHQAGQKFRVIVIIPLMPAFEGDVSGSGAATLRLVMNWQYQSISRGEHSIGYQLKKAGIEMDDYVRFYGLRTYDVIRRSASEQVINVVNGNQPNSPLAPDQWQHIKEQNGDVSTVTNNDDGVHKAVGEGEKNIATTSAGGYQWPEPNYHDENASRDGELDEQSSSSSDESEESQTEPHGKRSTLSRLVHGTEHIRHFGLSGRKSSSAKAKHARNDSDSIHIQDVDVDMDDVDNYDSIPMQSLRRQVVNNNYLNNTNVQDLKPQQENGDIDALNRTVEKSVAGLGQPQPADDSSDVVDQIVTELVYVHCKLLIVDDRVVVLGSANINDRSMLGNRDSEIALVLEDTDKVDIHMDGRPYKAAKFAHSLRTQLCLEHLGAIRDVDQKDLVVDQYFGNPPIRMSTSDADEAYVEMASRVVKDPLSDEFDELWNGTADSNAEIFRDVFRCVPEESVHNYSQYHVFVPSSNHPLGHAILDGTSVPEVLKKLKKVRGHIVPNPKDFLKDENLGAKLGDKEMLVPVEVFT